MWRAVMQAPLLFPMGYRRHRESQFELHRLCFSLKYLVVSADLPNTKPMLSIRTGHRSRPMCSVLCFWTRRPARFKARCQIDMKPEGPL